MESKNCPCGSKKKLQYCCGKYLLGREYPTTAEQLMRSRYTAFCQGNIDYLIATLHPDKRQTKDRQELVKTIQNTKWLGLTIVSSDRGKKPDKVGFVEFMAVFQIGEPQQLHERSRFTKIDGKWFYVDGDILPDLVLKKNQKCWCGSQQKYQKCHGK